MGKSRFIAVALAGMLGLGLLPGSGLSVTEAASYEGGRGHAYSQRLKEENERHERQVRENRGRYRRGEISQQQYDDNVIREQRHHDGAAELIRDEYEEQANNEYKMSPTSISGGGNLLTGGELISPASLKGQEEVLPSAKLEQWPYNEH